VKVPYREHVPPDVTAAIFWLKNRQPEKWRDKSETEVFGKGGGPIEVSPIEKKRRVVALILKVAKGDSEGPNQAAARSATVSFR
jgi:hypothetical protein